jgi:hypothetical protein
MNTFKKSSLFCLKVAQTGEEANKAGTTLSLESLVTQQPIDTVQEGV